MGDFKKLLVWQKAHALALRVHRAAARIRGSQNAALRNQMTRAAQSIVANIVEGRAQTSEREFGRFLGYSLGSSSELEQHLITAHDIKALPDTEFNEITAMLVEVRKMTHGLRSCLVGSTKE
jgi:four helix bundle protein